VLSGKGSAPKARALRSATIRIRNQGRFPASVSSHIPLGLLSEKLEFAREGVEDARIGLPAGASIRIESGAEVEVEIIWT
jgi:urease beta subunit